MRENFPARSHIDGARGRGTAALRHPLSRRQQRLTLLPGRAQSHAMTLARPVDASARDENGAAHPLARLLALGRPAVMGVLNVTPDSFSDGGRFLDPSIAIEQAQRMVAAGADVLDIGAESTRPYGGAVPVPIDEEIRRLAPVLPRAAALGVPVSIDTVKAQVAAWALASGASILTD